MDPNNLRELENEILTEDFFAEDKVSIPHPNPHIIQPIYTNRSD
jgi:hypothetical protein